MNLRSAAGDHNRPSRGPRSQHAMHRATAPTPLCAASLMRYDLRGDAHGALLPLRRGRQWPVGIALEISHMPRGGLARAQCATLDCAMRMLSRLSRRCFGWAARDIASMSCIAWQANNRLPPRAALALRHSMRRPRIRAHHRPHVRIFGRRDVAVSRSLQTTADDNAALSSARRPDPVPAARC